MEIVDRLAIEGGEGDLEMLRGRFPVGDQRERRRGAAELAALLPASALAQARVTHGREVEGIRGIEVPHPDPEVIDPAPWSHGIVPYRLGAVAIEVAEEGAVIPGRVLGALARRPIVLIAGAGSSPPELIDPLPRWCDEGDVQVPGRRMLGRGAEEAELVPLDPTVGGTRRLDAERAENSAVKALRRTEIIGTDRDVVEHAL